MNIVTALPLAMTEPNSGDSFAGALLIGAILVMIAVWSAGAVVAWAAMSVVGAVLRPLARVFGWAMVAGVLAGAMLFGAADTTATPDSGSSATATGPNAAGGAAPGRGVAEQLAPAPAPPSPRVLTPDAAPTVPDPGWSVAGHGLALTVAFVLGFGAGCLLERRSTRARDRSLALAEQQCAAELRRRRELESACRSLRQELGAIRRVAGDVDQPVVLVPDQQRCEVEPGVTTLPNLRPGRAPSRAEILRRRSRRDRRSRRRGRGLRPPPRRPS